MKLTALGLTFVIAVGLAAPLEAKSKTKAPKAPKVHRNASYKAPKVKSKPAKVKPMKFPKAKHAASAKAGKPPKARKVKTPRTV